MQGYVQNFSKNQVLCRKGDPSSDIYLLKSGKLIACTVSGTKVISLGRINPGEFVGELAFFDGRPRSSDVVCLEESEVILIPKHELSSLLPKWFIEVGKSLTKKIRLLDDIVQEANLKRFGGDENKPLSIEEQRNLLQAITHQDT